MQVMLVTSPRPWKKRRVCTLLRRRLLRQPCLFFIEEHMSEIHCSEEDLPRAAPDASPPSGMRLPAALTTAVAAATLAACDADHLVPSESKADTLDAWRFLNQATFGPKTAELDAFMATSYGAWIEAQMSEPQAISMYALTKENYNPSRAPLKIGPLYADPLAQDYDKRRGLLDRTHVSSAWWEKVLTGKDQLRQRVAYALSQILVIGMPHGNTGDMPYACASYYDLLLDNAFGSFTDLLAKVAGHPAMMYYLSAMSNERPGGNRIPDQNFAREIMQLFSIGLYMLNMDGTQQLDAQGKPIETYTPYDIEVLSHVFTGWGWQHSFGSFVVYHHFEESQTGPVKGYPAYHSTYDQFPKKDASGRVLRYPHAGGNVGTVTLLGKPLTLASSPGASEVSSAADVEADRRAALDIIFAHPNIAPFIARQMIQYMVTSNPSPQYVGRVARAFKSSKMNLGELVRAILLDKEARDFHAARKDTTFGRLREPLLRVTQFMRAFNARSVGNRFHVPSLAGVSGPSIAECLGQSPLESPSVFNFYRPGYMAPNSRMAAQGKVTPEMQISSETEVAAYIRFMEVTSLIGFGKWVKKNGLPIGGDDTDPTQWSELLSVYPDYTTEMSASVNQAKTPEERRVELVEVINRKLFGGTMSASLQAHLASLADRFSYASTSTGLRSDAMVRVATMAFVASVAPEYVVQR
jgi:uncharacterized protein (DUF1800 family)